MDLVDERPGCAVRVRAGLPEGFPQPVQLPHHPLFNPHVLFRASVEVINRHMEKVRDPGNQVPFRVTPVFPFGYCLGAHAQVLGQVFLGDLGLFPQAL